MRRGIVEAAKGQRNASGLCCDRSPEKKVLGRKKLTVNEVE